MSTRLEFGRDEYTRGAVVGRRLRALYGLLLEALDIAVGLEDRHNEVEHPEEKKDQRRGELWQERAAEFAADALRPPQ